MLIPDRAAQQSILESLFSGVDVSPLIHAAETFAQDFVEDAVCGAALRGFITRNVNNVIVWSASIQPLASTAAKHALDGLLCAEGVTLRARLWLAGRAAAAQ